MNTFGEVMDRVESAKGRLEKERVLKDLDETGIKILQIVLDPSRVFYQTADWDFMPVGDGGVSRKVFWEHVLDALNLMADRAVTGNAGRDLIESVKKKALVDKDIIWFIRCVNRNLRCGVSISTANKVFPGLVKKFEVSLAEKYDPGKHEKLLGKGTWIAEPKFDGDRMTVVGGVPYSRGGQVYESVDHILEHLKVLDPLDEYVWDGEVMRPGDFDEASGAIRRKRREGVGPDRSIYYVVFDLIRKTEWDSGRTRPLSERKAELDVLTEHPDVSSAIVDVVTYEPLGTQPTVKDVLDLRSKFMSDGYEGLMLKNLDAELTRRRTNDILKFKEMEDIDGIVVDVLEGKEDSKFQGTLGALVVEHDGGVMTKVGSGFTDAERNEIWADREGVIGSMVEVQYQNKTSDGVLRFPVFIRFRKDKE